MEEHRGVIGTIWLGSGVLVVVALVLYVFTSSEKGIRGWWLLRTLRQQLHELTEEEKEFLGKYLIGDTKTLELPVESGVVAGLRSRKIVALSSSLARYEWADHNILDWAWSYLRKYPELVLGGQGLQSVKENWPVHTLEQVLGTRRERVRVPPKKQ